MIGSYHDHHSFWRAGYFAVHCKHAFDTDDKKVLFHFTSIT